MISAKRNRESRSLRSAASVLASAVCLLFAAMTSGNVSAQTTPTLTVASSTATSSYGQSVTFTATISTGPTGNISFFSNGVEIGTSAITSGTTAILTTTNLPGGVDSITAEYAGNSNYNPVTSAPIILTVAKASPTVTVVSSGSPSAFGASVTFAATVSSSATTGTLTFYSNNAPIGTANVNQAMAAITTSTLSAGNDVITAQYSGDANFNAVTSPAITQVVNKATPTVAVASSESPSTYGASVTFTATVTAGATGNVTFYSNGVPLGTEPLAGDTATLATTALPGGVDHIKALYSGDATYSAATSPVITQVVNKAIPTIIVATSGSPSEPGAPVTFTATMSVGPTGSVTFYVDGKPYITSPLQGNIASMTTSTLTVGTFRVTGVYSADSNYASVTSASILQTVGQPIASTAPDEWTWLNGSMDVNHTGDYGTLGTPADLNTPGARFYPSTWVDSTGGQWLFGGLGLDSAGATGKQNDLWQFNTSINQWAWESGSTTVGAAGGQPGVYGTLGTAASANLPGGRQEAMSWADKNGNLWLFGGLGFDEAGTDGLLNDLWEFNLTTSVWTWVGGSNTIPACTGSNCGATGVYGTIGSAAQANVPGARYNGSTWVDQTGNLWLFGGSGIDSNGTFGKANDLWEFAPTSGQWTWVGGNSTFGSGSIAGVYGVLGTAASGNWPGSRDSASTWTDAKGNFWLFGGEGVDANGNAGLLNDLWMFNPSTGEWTWVAGSSTVGTGGQPGVYGTLSTFAVANTPGGRDGAMTWLDSQGILWLFAGNGFDSAHNSGALNDLWEFDPGSSQWAWMAGSNASGPPPVFGTLGSAAPTNVPGGREYGASWTDLDGNFWLFGGEGADAKAAFGPMNDVWEFTPYPIVITPILSVAGGTYGASQTVTISDATAGATIYYTTNGTTPTKSSTVYSGAITVSTNETLEAVATLSGYTTSPVATATFTLVSATPTFSPAAGTFTAAQSVTLSDTTSGAVIYYTLDGSTPTTSSSQYSTPLAISQNTTINAIAAAPGQNPSPVATATYTITPPAATPTFSPSAGTYTSSQTVTISDTTSEATIYYTTDGSTPTTSSTQFTSPISVSTNETIQAIATATGYSSSAVASAVYSITPPAATPVFNVTTGTYLTAQTVTISDSTPGAKIYYTIDGSTPTTGSTVYNGSITVSASETIEAAAIATGYSLSAVASATYTITPSAAIPAFSVAAGTYTSAQTVSISDSTAGAIIYFTTDGSTPTTGSPVYSAPITVSASETIEAFATATGLVASPVNSAAYVINLTPPDFFISVSPTLLTAASGQSVTADVLVTPTSGFNGAVTFACSGLPSGAACTFAPTTVTPNGGPVTTTLTVATTSTSAALRGNSIPFVPGVALAAMLFVFGFRKRLRLPILLLLVASAIGLVTVSGCGGSGSQTKTTPPTVSTVTITATSGMLQHTTTFSLTVTY